MIEYLPIGPGRALTGIKKWRRDFMLALGEQVEIGNRPSRQRPVDCPGAPFVRVNHVCRPHSTAPRHSAAISSTSNWQVRAP